MHCLVRRLSLADQECCRILGKTGDFPAGVVQMRRGKRMTFVALATIGLAIALAAGVLGLARHPRWFSVYEDIDSCSGDIRRRVFLFDVRIHSRITDTAFSREIRRLNIRIPEKPDWKSMHADVGANRHISCEYDGAISDCNFLIQWLDLMGVPDEYRVAVLEKALSNLQTGNLDGTDELIYEIAEEVRRLYGLPRIPEEERRKTFNEHRIIR
jgi:hypothetical protein